MAQLAHTGTVSGWARKRASNHPFLTLPHGDRIDEPGDTSLNGEQTDHAVVPFERVTRTEFGAARPRGWACIGGALWLRSTLTIAIEMRSPSWHHRLLYVRTICGASMAGDRDLLKWIPQLLRGAVSALAWWIFAFLFLLIVLSYWIASLSEYLTLWSSITTSLALIFACALGAAKFSGVTRLVPGSDPSFQISIWALLIIIFAPTAIICAKLGMPVTIARPFCYGIIIAIIVSLCLSPAVVKAQRQEASFAQYCSTPLWVSGVILTLGSDLFDSRFGTGYLNDLIPARLLHGYLDIKLLILEFAGIMFTILVTIDVVRAIVNRTPAVLKRPDFVRSSDILIPTLQIPDSSAGFSRLKITLERGGLILAHWIAETKIWISNRWAMMTYHWAKVCLFIVDAAFSFGESLWINLRDMLGRDQWKASLMISLAIVLNVFFAPILGKLLVLVHMSYSDSNYDLFVMVVSVVGLVWTSFIVYVIFEFCYEGGHKVSFITADVALPVIRGALFASLFGHVFYLVAAYIDHRTTTGLNFAHGHYFFNGVAFAFALLLVWYWSPHDANETWTKMWPRYVLFCSIVGVIIAWLWHVVVDDFPMQKDPLRSLYDQRIMTRPEMPLMREPINGRPDASLKEFGWLDGSWGFERSCGQNGRRFDVTGDILRVTDGTNAMVERQKIVEHSRGRIRTETAIFETSRDGIEFRELNTNFKVELVKCD